MVSINEKLCVGKYDFVMCTSEIYVNVSIILNECCMAKYGWRKRSSCGVLGKCVI